MFGKYKNGLTVVVTTLSLVSATLLDVSPASAARISVSTIVGDNLIDACSHISDAKFIDTKQGHYSGCCSKLLGYCVLCEIGGSKCYKFTHIRALNVLRQEFAPDGNLIADDRPVRPRRGTAGSPGAVSRR